MNAPHHKSTNAKTLLYTFRIPFCIALSIVCSLIVPSPYKQLLLLGSIGLGSLGLIKETITSLLHRKFVLDYIALFAIAIGLITGQYTVAAIIVLMLSGGTTLEAYGQLKAKQSLTALADRIPDSVYLWDGSLSERVAVKTVTIGQQIAVRKGEVIPLDGILESHRGYVDESSLTGEPYEVEKIKGDSLRSGIVNVGELIVLTVTREEKDSTYKKIVDMVTDAQQQKAPLLRLADKYSTIFTIITFCIASVAYLATHDISRVLAVLVIATPCPLILATPISLMGGVNAAAKKRIIVKKLASLEVLSRVTTLIFDKTGTITIGKPRIRAITILDHDYSEAEVMSIAAAIERTSLHPIGKAITSYARYRSYPRLYASEVTEELGSGITGTVGGEKFTISKMMGKASIVMTKGRTRIATMELEDRIKDGSKHIIHSLIHDGIDIHIFTGDKKQAVAEIVAQIGEPITVAAELSPEDKKRGVESLRKNSAVTAMVGDGINDAPAIAIADVGMVFSHEEHTAASEAADIIFLGGDFESVAETIAIGKRTIRIAMESILVGIGLSIVGMILAGVGLIPPIMGAFLQEAIDVAVILNALRASM